MSNFDLCALPVSQPPDGEVSNLVDPYSLAKAMIAICTIMLAWALPFVSIRIWVNRHKLKIADAFVIICALWDVSFTAIILTQARYGRHQWNVPICWFDGQYMKTVFLVSVLFGFISFGKASILLLYQDIFSVSKATSVAIWIGLVFNFLIYIPSIPIAAFFEAPKPGQTWEQVLYDSANLKETLVPYGITTGAAAVLMDIYIFVLPLPIILKLNLSRSKKIQVVTVFATALLAVLAGIIALVYRIKLIDKNDSTWSTSCFYISLIVENNIVLIVASMPAFASFFRSTIAGSAFYGSLRSRFISRHSGSKASSHPEFFGSNEQPSFPMPVLRTVGGSVQPWKQTADSYHKLNDPAYGISRTTIQSDGPMSYDSIHPTSNKDSRTIGKTTTVTQKSEPGSAV